MTDMATLRIVVDADGAIRQVDRFGNVVEDAAKKTEKLETEATRAGRAMSDAAGDAAEMGKETAQAMRNIERAAGAIGTMLGTVAVLAVVNFFTKLIEESRRAREEAQRAAEEWEKAMRRMVNAGDVARMQKEAQDVYLGTPAEQFKDGIVEQQKLVEEMRAAQADAFGQLGAMFSGDAEALRVAQEELDRRIQKFEEIRRRILDTQNVPFLRYGADPITTTASRGGGSDGAAVAIALDKFDRRLKGLVGTLDEGSAAAEKMARRLKESISGPKGLAEDFSKMDASLKRILGSDKDEARRIAEVFYEQMQITLARFFSDFLQDGLRSLPEFWERFKQLGFDTIGQIAAKRTMERFGSRIEGAVDGVLGFAKSNPAVAAGLAAGAAVVAGITSAFNGTSKWERAAEQQQAAAKAMLEAARAQKDWTHSFLDYSGSESPMEREMRQMIRGRDELARRAFENAGKGGSFDALVSGTGSWEGLVGQIRNYANEFGGVWVQLLENLEKLDEAYRNNTESIRAAAEAERMLTYQRQIDSLTGFRDSLLLSNQSPLSPTAQLAEARRQYETILALAQAGDASAIASLPETARAFLDASSRVNASSSRYAADFNRVQSDTAAVIAAIEEQRDSSPVWVGEFLDRVDPYLSDAVDLQTAQLTVQQEGFQMVVAELVNVREEIKSLKTELKFGVVIGDEPVLY